MLQTLNGFMSWFVSNPRRMFMVLLLVTTLLVVMTMVVPDGVALAGSITSGS